MPVKPPMTQIKKSFLLLFSKKEAFLSFLNLARTTARSHQ